MNFNLKTESIVYKIPEKSETNEELIWSLDSFKQIKCELNSVKSGLNDIDLSVWSNHTSKTDKSPRIFECLRRQLTRKPFLLTNAWIKIYEIISKFKPIETLITKIINENKSVLNVLLLCECPGSFINAINHYIKSHAMNVRLEWMANTLNPYYEDIDYTISDDIFIRNIALFDNWFFGSTNTGNILDINFISDLKQEMKNRNIEKFLLITCDGSVNCVDCPQSQEQVVQPLISKEILISLEVLANEGFLVVKCFTLFECQSVCLLYLLCCAFKEVNVFKPNASKSGNSEIYLICIGFQSSLELNSIISIVSTKSDSKALFSRQSIPQSFCDKLEECLKYFIDNQISEIKNNLQLFKSMDEKKRQQIVKSNEKFAKQLIKQLNIFSISSFEELVLDCDQCLTNCLKFKKLNELLINNKSYSDRQQNDFFDDLWFEKLNKVLNQINENPSLVNNLIELKYWKQSSDTKLFEIKYIYGMPFNQIRNSKFCDLSLIISYNKCLKYEEKFKNIGKNFISFSTETKTIIEELIKKYQKNFKNIVISCEKSFDQFVKQLSIDTNLGVITVLTDCLKLETQSPNIYVINAFREFNLDLIEEKSVLIELILQFCRMNRFICEKDLLIVQIGLSLTRLMSAVLYIISKRFRFYSFVPCLGSDEQNRHGLIGLFQSKTDDNKQSDEEIKQKLNEISNELMKSKKSLSLVEIICVPLLISDFKFYETLFNANSLQTIELLKIMSNLITK